MLLQALVNHYEILAEDNECDIPRQGYSSTKVSYVLVLSEEGQMLDIHSIKTPDEKGKKYIPQSIEVPEQAKRAVGIMPYFLCDNSSYVFGLDNKGKPERSKKCFEEFKKLHEIILNESDCKEAKAVLLFLQNWIPETASENPLIISIIDEIYAGANFIFRLDGQLQYIHQSNLIKKLWISYKSTLSNDSIVRQCLISGEKAAIARLHPAIKGIRGGQAMGNTLVAFNASAYESYGNYKDQGLNAPIGEYQAFAYGTVLNRMLSDNSHRITFGDSTVVFWAESKQNDYFQDVFSFALDPNELQQIGTDKQKFLRDDNAAKEAKSIFMRIANGKMVGSEINYNNDTRFYILALSPNAARISIRFFLVDSFSDLISKISRHYKDLLIEKQFENDMDAIPIWRLLNETVSPKSKDKASSPLLSGSVLRAVLTGSPYPAALFNTVMLRIRAEKDINYIKAAIIKAYLLRLHKNEKYKEVLTMSLEPKSDIKAYNLGRLFAVLEKTQKDSSETELNTTIKDRYFTSACANPAITFPTLLRLSTHHIKKAKYGSKNDDKIGEILDMLNVNDNPFPKNLSLEDQGLFVLGYYHQKNKIYADIKAASEAKKVKNNAIIDGVESDVKTDA